MNIILLWDPHLTSKSSTQIADCLQGLSEQKKPRLRWSLGTNFKKIKEGDGVAMWKSKSKNSGFYATGKVLSKPYLAKSWKKNKISPDYYIDIEVQQMINPYDAVVTKAIINKYSPDFKPSFRASGAAIPSNVFNNVITLLEKGIPNTENIFTEEVSDEDYFWEGAIKQVKVNKFERDIKARQKCIQIFGHKCRCCDMDFEEKYGKFASGFIHVHHIVPLSQIRKGYKVDPKRDLRPVCPNCHSMIHKRNPIYSIEEIRDLYKSRKLREF